MLVLRGRFLAVVAMFVATIIARIPAAAADSPDLTAAKDRYARIVAAELERKIVPGVSIAWVVDGKLVHAAGYGIADEQRGTPTTSETIYRAGSISKLFNAVAAMQLVQQGKLDLDAPIQTALPEFQITVPFADAPPITARQLLCHRSGMIRESPVGGYLDDRQPTVAATVASVAGCALVNAPNTKTRYSNVGPTIVGRAVEVISGQEYAEYQARHLLGPLSMTGSAWRMNDSLRPRLAKGRMRMANGDGTYRYESAPEFELGTLPAGNLYTTAPDLARFAAFVMGTPGVATPELLSSESLAKMLEVQLTGEPNGFGLGFGVNRYRGHRTAQHNGAVYGFSTSLVVLPAEKIGVVVLTNADIAGAPVRRLTEAALDLLLEAVKGEKPTEPPAAAAVTPEELSRLAGHYESTSYWAELRVENGALVGDVSGQPITLAARGEGKFVADGRNMNRAPVEFDLSGDRPVTGFTALGQKFHPVAPDETSSSSAAWRPLLGSYGPAFIPIVLSVRHGHLYAQVENEYDYRLTQVDRATFRLPSGMYDDEQIVIQFAPDGRVLGLLMANMYLPRCGN